MGKKFVYQRYPKHPSSGKVSSFQRKLGKTDPGSRNSGDNTEWIQNSVYGNSKSNQKSISISTESRRGGNDQHRGSVNATEGCNLESDRKLSGSISEQPIFGGKKGRGKSSCDQSEGIEQIHSIQTFQNGRFALLEILNTTKRLLVQSRLKGRLFFCTHPQQLQKICEISLVRQSIRVPVLMFWPGSSPKDFFKIAKNTNCNFEENQCSSNNFSRQYITDGENASGNVNESRHIYFSITESRFCNQSEKICVTTNSSVRIFGNANKHNQHVSISNKRKIRESDSKMLGVVQPSKNQHFRVNEAYWSSFINNSGCTSSTNSASVFTAATDTNAKPEKILPVCNHGQSGGKNGTIVVDRKSQDMEWQRNQSSGTANDDTDGCINPGLGSILQFDIHREGMVQTGGYVAHKYPRVTSNKICTPDLYQGKIKSCNSLSGGQQDCFSILTQDGRYPQQSIIEHKQRNMEIPVRQTDHNYCRVPPEQAQCSSRLGVQKLQEHVRLETRLGNFSKNNKSQGISGDRPFCIQAMLPVTTVHILETRPHQYRNIGMHFNNHGIRNCVMHSLHSV